VGNLSAGLAESSPMSMLTPLFLKLAGRAVLVVGGGPVATAKARTLADAGAAVTVVSPALTSALAALAAEKAWPVRMRAFAPSDLDGMWLAIAGAPPEINRQVAAAAEARRIFMVAVDDPGSSSAYGGGVVRRGGVTVALSTDGEAPALAGLLREGLEAMLPDELAGWLDEARRLRAGWRTGAVPMSDRRPLLLAALNRLYESRQGAGG
jgi:uroporphyrin-III C-methyltransferase / precorrin-2 dehydrogenase / sirohydrochlorin ferrochelatase